MNLIKWIFQPAYLLLIIVLVAIYVNREAIFTDKIAESNDVQELVAKVNGLVEGMSESASESSSPSQLEPGSEVSSNAATSTENESVESIKDDEPSLLSQSENVSQETDTDTESAPQLEVVAESDAIAEQAVPEVAENIVVDNDEAQVIVDPEDKLVVAAETPATSKPEARVVSDENTSPLALWRSARAAVWQGDIELAIENYRQLIVAQPGNYDAHGELGNVLLSQSDIQGAIKAYSEAARLINKAGHRIVAGNVVRIVMSLDESEGRALYGELSAR